MMNQKSFMKRFWTLGVTVILALLPFAVGAQETVGTFDAWTVAKHKQGNQVEAAYALSRPTSSEGKYTTRGQVYALITYWRNGEKTLHFEMGYPVKEGSDVTVTVLNARGKALKTFKFVPHNEEAWAPANQDDQIIDACKSAATLLVEGVSKRGTVTKDIYSLKGITLATKKAQEQLKIAAPKSPAPASTGKSSSSSSKTSSKQEGKKITVEKRRATK